MAGPSNWGTTPQQLGMRYASTECWGCLLTGMPCRKGERSEHPLPAAFPGGARSPKHTATRASVAPVRRLRLASLVPLGPALSSLPPPIPLSKGCSSRGAVRRRQLAQKGCSLRRAHRAVSDPRALPPPLRSTPAMSRASAASPLPGGLRMCFTQRRHARHASRTPRRLHLLLRYPCRSFPQRWPQAASAGRWR